MPFQVYGKSAVLIFFIFEVKSLAEKPSQIWPSVNIGQKDHKQIRHVRVCTCVARHFITKKIYVVPSRFERVTYPNKPSI